MAAPTEAGVASGRIVTFYSYKGGVGRTMALANTAFLAAMNGCRVLVMDWDLEAPGLAYYFRGMQEGTGLKAIRTAPGVLDLVWEWSAAVRSATSVAEVDALSDRFASGAPFEAAATPLISDLDLGAGRLDLIGAGRNVVATPEPTSYEEALARFDWGGFFAEEAGGSMLASLKEWGRRNYDYVLVDSRTGLADVAGVCTMQLPDAVALCFVYNRQNIEGIARVAGVIRERRGADVGIHPAPMRVARENTPEEADARAYARRELTRRGGLTAEQVDRGAKFLSIRAAANVPFYETVAPVASDRPETDPLVLGYLNFANELLGRRFEVPILNDRWIASVSRKLQPRNATTDYVLKLRSSDPGRAIAEVTQLLESASEFRDIAENETDYINTLVDVALHLARATDPIEAIPIYSAAADLLRNISESDHSWRTLLAEVLQSYLENAAIAMEPEEELILLDEADALLALQSGPEARVRRVANRRRAARVQIESGQIDLADLTIGELQRLLAEDAAARRGTTERPAELVAAEVDVRLLRGDVSAERQANGDALHHYEEALRAAGPAEADARPELVRLRSEVHGRLARLPPSVMAAEPAAGHAINVLRFRPTSGGLVLQFIELGRIVNAANDVELTAEFVGLALASDDRARVQLTSYFGRAYARMEQFVDYSVETLGILRRGGLAVTEQATQLLEVAIAILQRPTPLPTRLQVRRTIDRSPLVRRLLQAVSEATGMLPADSSTRLLALLDGRKDAAASDQGG